MNQNYCTEDATVITYSSQNPNFPASNLKNPFRSKSWRSTGVTSEYVVFDLITTEAIDSVVLLWPKENGITLSNTATVTVQANPTNNWTSPALSQTMTINDTYMIASYYFTSDQSYRYWRVLIQDPGNANGYLELGQVWIGKSLTMSNMQNGFEFDLIDLSVHTQTPFGHDYVDEYPLQSALIFQYQNLSYTDVQTLDTTYRTNSTKLPVLIVLDETGTLFNKDHFVIYGKFSNKLPITHVNYNVLGTNALTVLELS